MRAAARHADESWQRQTTFSSSSLQSHLRRFSSSSLHHSSSLLAVFFLFSILCRASAAGPASAPLPLPLSARQPATPSPIPAYTPIVTPAPDQNAVLSKMGYAQETYYACQTIGDVEHCGWHIPIVQAVAEGAAQGIGPVARTDTGVVAAVLACVAGAFAFGLM